MNFEYWISFKTQNGHMTIYLPAFFGMVKKRDVQKLIKLIKESEWCDCRENMVATLFTVRRWMPSMQEAMTDWSADLMEQAKDITLGPSRQVDLIRQAMKIKRNRKRIPEYQQIIEEAYQSVLHR